MAAAHAREQALALYRKGLALSRQLADPCARHYAFGRVTHAFRCVAASGAAQPAGGAADARACARARDTASREQHETSPTRVRHLLHDARKSVRRLGRAVSGEPDDVKYLLELAYGKRGRVQHVLQRARQQARASAACWAATPT